MNTSESDHSQARLGEPGNDAESLRGELRTIASASGFRRDALVEWCSTDAPGTPADLPPLYYAALLPGESGADMPLGLGDTPAAALTDLLWALGGSSLVSALRAHDPAADEQRAACQAPYAADADARGESH